MHLLLVEGASSLCAQWAPEPLGQLDCRPFVAGFVEVVTLDLNSSWLLLM